MGFSEPLEFFKSIPETVSVTTLPSGHTVLRGDYSDHAHYIFNPKCWFFNAHFLNCSCGQRKLITHPGIGSWTET